MSSNDSTLSILPRWKLSTPLTVCLTTTMTPDSSGQTRQMLSRRKF
jgi:hypothetical protein